MGVNYTPGRGNYTDLKPFRFWCQKVLPLVYDDSLSYYELLCKVVDYLNKTMEDVTVLDGDVTALHEAYKQLQNYINNYFDNLNVQEEVNNKLDKMAEDGSLTILISAYLNPLVAAQNERISTLETSVNSSLTEQTEFNNVTRGMLANTYTAPIPISTESDIPEGENAVVWLSESDVGPSGFAWKQNYWYYTVKESGTITFVTEGGLYQATGVQTDKTLAIPDMAADAQETGNKISELMENINATQNGYSYLFGYGTFTNGTLFNGAIRPNVKYRIASTSILQFDNDIELEVSDSFKFGVHTFINGEFSQDTGWHTSPYIIPANTQFKMVFARRSEYTSEIADISTFIKQVSFKTETQQNVTAHKNHIYKGVTTIAEGLLSQGGLSDVGADDSWLATASARTDLLFAINDIAIYTDLEENPDARIYVHYFDDTGAWISADGWASMVIIKKGSIFRLLLRKEYTSETAHSVDEIFSAFHIFANNKINNLRPCVIVSHQGNVNTTDNYCKADGYIRAGLAGFDYAECDVKFTSDDVPVCSHDGSFIDATTGTRIRIESYTFEELQNFDYYGGKIASLDEIIAICKKYGIGLYLDQYNPTWSDARYNAIFKVINKYRFAKFCKHIIYEYACADKILARDKTAWIICGQSYASETPNSAIELADSVITDYNKVDVMFNRNLGVNTIINASINMDARFGINVYTFDNASQKRAWSPYITSITTDKDSNIYM